MKAIFLSPLFFLLIACTDCLSQTVDFKEVPPPNGSTFGNICAITQDKQGYMWIATSRGLYRYDGKHYNLYRNDSLNENSLASNLPSVLYEENDSILWVGTWDNGLDRFNFISGTFTHFKHEEKNSITNDTITAVTKDHLGNIWIGTLGGVNIFNEKSGKFSNYTFNTQDSTSISSNYIKKIYEDREGTVWIGTGTSDYQAHGDEGGLNRYNRKNRNFVRYLHNPKDTGSLLENNIADIFEDSRGVFWVGTAGDGLHIMNRKTGTFQRLSYDVTNPSKLSMPHLKGKLTDAFISFIRGDATGAIWIGAHWGGVNRYDPKTQKITHFEYDPGSADAGNFHLTWPRISFTSFDNVFWIGTEDGYLYHLDPFHQNIPSYKLYSEGARDAMAEAAPGVLMIADENNGIITITESTWSFKNYYNHPDDSTSISSTGANCLTKDHNGIIWIGTWGGGLNWFDMNTQKFNSFRHDSANIYSLSDDRVTAVFEDSNYNLWVGTFAGIDKFDRNTGFFTHFPYHPKDTTDKGYRYFAKSISVDNANNLWIGTNGSGVYKIDIKTGKFENYLKGTYIPTIYRDANKVLWVGNYDGLFRYNETTDEFTRFQDMATSAITDVTGILEDNNKNLWLSGSNDIIKINSTRDKTSVYGKSFGIRPNSLNSGSGYCKAQDGKLFFSTDSGFIAFYPDQLTVHSKPPLINLDNFKIGDKVVKFGNDGPLHQSLYDTKELNLNYDQNIFSFDIAVPDFTNPDENQVFYMLEGYETSWRPAGSDQKAYYFNIPPDKYTFRVKAANSYGLWAEKDMIIIISPPWWETWWFRVLSVIALVIVIYAIIKERSRKLKAENILLEKKVNERTQQLQQSIHELKSTQAQLIQSEKMASLGELTAGIAHEIQNPLNFVNNFSEVNKELLAEMKDEMNKGHLDDANAIANDVIENSEKINHHGKRAEAIVKGMLQHSRSSSGTKEPTNINALADEYLRLAYHGLRAKEKDFNVTFETDFDAGIEKINVVPQDIGRVLLNLYNNAFYAVNEKKKLLADGYQPIVKVTTKKLNDKIVISVEDNGNGIPQKIVDKIFQPFFTTKPTGEGTGLGLSLSYDIIKAHGGDIKVSSKENEGTTFIIDL